MDRIRLYEAANNTEAMNEIKAACSNMRNCIRKYASGKTNVKVKNEMLEGMKKIETDLKAVVRSGAKAGKKINESLSGVDDITAYTLCDKYFFDNWLDCYVDSDDLEAAFLAGYNGEDIPTEYGDLYTGKDYDYYENAYELGNTFSQFKSKAEMVDYCVRN